MEERVQKLMAQADIGSRRACEELITQGRVQVNGKTITLGDKADPAKDVITVDGAKLKLENRRLRYFVVNKPRNMLSTTQAEEGDDRPTVREQIPHEGHLFTVGRLDADSEGMMVLTNDGELANKLSHPRYEHTKTYKVTVIGHPTADVLEKWERGVWLDDSRTAPCHIRVLETTPRMTTLRIVMIEGRKRQIRRVAALLGHQVFRLLRTHIGQLGIGTLQKGEWYEMGEEEVAAMQIPAEEVKFLRRKRRILRVRDEGTFAARDVRPGSPKPRPSKPQPAASSSRTPSSGSQGETSDEAPKRRKPHSKPPARKYPDSKRPAGKRPAGKRPAGKRPDAGGSSRSTGRKPQRRQRRKIITSS